MNPIPAAFLPPTGVVVPGIACAHMYKTDGGFVFFEGFISNPDTSHQDRVDALHTIIHALTDLAKEAGYSTAYAMTSNQTISSGCIENGFENIGNYTMFEKDI